MKLRKKEVFNMLVMGQIGAGKSNFMRHLLSYTPRAIVFDRVDEYETATGFTSFRESAEFFKDHLRSNFHIIIKSSDEAVFTAWLELLFTTQMSDPTIPPVALFMDEASYFSDSHSIPKVVDQIYTKGRHAGINIVTAAQRMTQIHPIIRDQTHVWVMFKLMSFPSDLKDRLNTEQRDQIPELLPYIPLDGKDPIYGKNVIHSLGADFDIVGRWVKMNPGGGGTIPAT